MKAKKRYVVGFWIATSLVVALAIGMVAVIAAFTATTTSGFSVSYTAKNVNATVTAGKVISDVDIPTDSNYASVVQATKAEDLTYDNFGNKTFNSTNKETETGSFEDQAINFTNKNQCAFIKYSIKNNKGDAFKCDITYTVTKVENLEIEYKTSDTATWTALTDSTEITKSSLAAGETFECYVRIYLDNRNAASVIEGGKFQIDLSVVE